MLWEPATGLARVEDACRSLISSYNSFFLLEKRREPALGGLVLPDWAILLCLQDGLRYSLKVTGESSASKLCQALVCAHLPPDRRHCSRRDSRTISSMTRGSAFHPP